MQFALEPLHVGVAIGGELAELGSHLRIGLLMSQFLSLVGFGRGGHVTLILFNNLAKLGVAPPQIRVTVSIGRRSWCRECCFHSPEGFFDRSKSLGESRIHFSSRVRAAPQGRQALVLSLPRPLRD